MSTIVADTSYISITIENKKYTLEHMFKYNGKTFQVEVEYYLDKDDFSGRLMEERSYSQAQTYGKWSYLNSTWNDYHRFVSFAEVAAKLPHVDESIIPVTLKGYGNASNTIVIKLLKLGEYMIRGCSYWKNDTIVINYVKGAHEGGKATCSCTSCSDLRNAKRYDPYDYCIPREYKTERECKKEKPEEVVPDEPPPPELPRTPTRAEERQSWVNWMYGLDD